MGSEMCIRDRFLVFGYWFAGFLFGICICGEFEICRQFISILESGLRIPPRTMKGNDMDIMTTLALGQTTSQLVNILKGQVIGRWTKRRADNFFRAFLEEVELANHEGCSKSLHEMMDQIVENETCCDVIFDAYRSVCLTKSKSIGPKIIGLKTAELVLEEREADSYEEDILEAAESLSDNEFQEFVEFYRDNWPVQ